MSSSTRPFLLWWPVVLLGFATIGAYGTVYYAIGVLIPAIASEEGWSLSTLSAAFAVGVIGQGGLALVFGSRFDRLGSRAVLIPALLLGTLALLLASRAGESWQFLVAWASGSAAIGGGLYYNVTMPITTRLFPERRATAFAVLTLLGALASPIFYPLAGWLVESIGWRGALQVLTLTTFVCVAPAALVVRAPGSVSTLRSAGLANFVQAVREPQVTRLLLVFGLAGLANSAVLLNQVGALEATGVSLATASALAGLRGAFQVPGRLFLSRITARLGIPMSVATCHALACTATLALLLALLGASHIALVVYFVAVSGMSLGLLSPLNGLLQAESFVDARLGTLSGVTVVVTSLAGAMGAWLSGLSVETTGSYSHILVAAIVLQALAAAVLLRGNWGRTQMPAKAQVPDPSWEDRSESLA